MHDFGVRFQNGQNLWIYRAPGKSKIRTVFWFIPYVPDQKIGAMDGDSDSEFPDLGPEMSLFRGTLKSRKNGHFRPVGLKSTRFDPGFRPKKW